MYGKYNRVIKIIYFNAASFCKLRAGFRRLIPLFRIEGFKDLRIEKLKDLKIERLKKLGVGSPKSGVGRKQE